MSHRNFMDTSVICPPSQSVIEFKHGGLRLERKELKELENIESSGSFGGNRSRWEPSHAK